MKGYFLYDPTADYLEPPLQGSRFAKGRPTLIRPSAAGHLVSRCLKLTLRLGGLDLMMADQKTGERLMTQAEYAEAELRAAPAEIARLRRQLGQSPLDE